MEKFLTTLGGTLAVFAAIFLIVPLATLFGGIAGSIIGIFFGEMILGALASFGVDTANLTMFQLGATLAFVGSFFKTTTSSLNKDS